MSYRLLTLLVSWLVMVSVGSTATAAALTAPGSAPGISHTVHDTRRVAAIGALFHGPVASGDHFCSAGVVDSPAGDLLVTAAHCVSADSGDGLYFVPGYHDGSAPYGAWRLDQVTVAPAWTEGQDPDLDVAFVTVLPHDGREVQDVVGGYPLDTDREPAAVVRLSGYPSTADAPLTCVNRTSAVSASQLRIACTSYGGGTSGSPWVTRDHRVIGVIGGYEEGGDSPDVSYSPYFGPEVEGLYEQAISPS
jgi:V8-like Glu-specific endopeptidase